jgi:Rho termination factor, N-terminal domain
VTTSSEQSGHNRRSPRRRIVGPIRASRSLGRAVVKFMPSIGRLRGSPFKRTGAGGKKGTARLRKLSDGSVATIRRSITATRGLPARAARQIRRRAGRRGDLASGIRRNGATPEPADRGDTARSRTETAVTSIGRTAQRGRQAGERAPAREQDQVEAKPARARAQTRRARQRRAAPPQAKLGQANRRQGLEQRTVAELREQAREAGIKGRSSMTKEQLIKALRSHR